LIIVDRAILNDSNGYKKSVRTDQVNFARTSPPVQERLWYRFDPYPLPSWEPKTLKAGGNIFENC